MAKEVQDFGQKIGGARKDFYRNALCVDDMEQMNDAELSKYVKRDNIWKREDPKKLMSEGISREVTYWRNKMRLCIYPTPLNHSKDFLERYIHVISNVRNMVLSVQTESDLKAFYEKQFAPAYFVTNAYSKQIVPEAKGVFNTNIFSTVDMSIGSIKRYSQYYGMTDLEKKEHVLRKNLVIAEYGKDITLTTYIGKQCFEYHYPADTAFFYESTTGALADIAKENTFLIANLLNHQIMAGGLLKQSTAEEMKEHIIKTALSRLEPKKEIKNRKKQFPIPQIANVKRIGPECPSENVTGDDFIETFGIRGGEFGIWMSDADARGSLNRCYEAFCDLSRILDISPKDISFQGTLSIGFGSRGHSAAAAHYEPERKVINLTKYHGQGALCHEWGHVLDDKIGQVFGLTRSSFASENLKKKEIPLVFRELMETMRYKTIEKDTDETKTDYFKKIDRYKRYYEMSVNSYQLKDMDEENLKKWNALVEEGWQRKAESTEEFKRSFSLSIEYSNPVVTQLSEMRKKLCGRVIPKEARDQIIQNLIAAKRLEAQIQDMPKTKTVRVETDFYISSQKFDTVFTKHGHGYWSSAVEMFARAFDCYISDKLKERGELNDYLTYGADSFTFPIDGIRYAAIPEGEERKIINQKFDQLFEYLKKEKFFKN